MTTTTTAVMTMVRLVMTRGVMSSVMATSRSRAMTVGHRHFFLMRLGGSRGTAVTMADCNRLTAAVVVLVVLLIMVRTVVVVMVVNFAMVAASPIKHPPNHVGKRQQCL
mmetsp:Transcript_9861/g.13645  ORF Transcript_9861/g.13645 Transcript_9861/m.13645 type:complete len:109 (-) Transcript_9861:528-854(-)